MTENSFPDNHGIIPYQPSTELIRRGLEDLALALKAVRRFLHVPNEYATVQIALTQAQAGDTIEVSPGIYAENIVIDKAVTIRGRGGLVVLRPARDNEPVLLVQCSHGSIVFENLSIRANTKVFNQQQVGIHIAQGRAEIRHCRFERWHSLHSDIPREEVPHFDDREYWDNYEESSGILVDGTGSEVIIEECSFSDCETSVEVEDSKLHIVGCDFSETYTTPLIVTNSQLIMYGNSFLDMSHAVLSLGQHSYVESDHDTFDIWSDLVSCVNSERSTITFSHATVLCRSLIGIGIGESDFHPNPNGEWIWMKPKMTFLNSIIVLDHDGPTIPYAPSHGEWWGDPEVINIWDAVEILGPNLLCIDSRPNQIDPEFAPFEDHGRLPLLPNSLALNAASDGTHLGAWQGMAP